MVVMSNVFESAINWLIDIVKYLSGVWSDLSEVVFDVGDLEVSWLGLISVSAISVVLIMKLIDLLPII